MTLHFYFIFIGILLKKITDEPTMKKKFKKLLIE